MSEPRRYEKNEKDEKEDEKRREKDEKSWDEKWRRDPVSTVGWAAILIWIGLVLLAENIGFNTRYTWWNNLALIFIGVGAIVLVKALVRTVVPEYRRPAGGNLVLGVVFLSLGLAWLLGWGTIWPIALIAIGIALLLYGLLRRR